MRDDRGSATRLSSTKFVPVSTFVDMRWTSGGETSEIGGSDVDTRRMTEGGEAPPSEKLLAGDVHTQLRGDLGMNPDGDDTLAERLDGLVEV